MLADAKKRCAALTFSKMGRHVKVLIAIAASAAAFTAPRSLPTAMKSRTAMQFSAAEAELVPRDVLFGNPEYCAGVGINCTAAGRDMPSTRRRAHAGTQPPPSHRTAPN